MSNISLAGIYPKVWMAWLLLVYGAAGRLAYVALSVWAGRAEATGIATAAIAILLLGVLFIPIEVNGARLNAKTPGDQEVARTLSQLMQFFAHRTPGHMWWRGWNGFVTLNCGMVWLLIAIAMAGTLGGLAHWLGLSGTVPAVVIGVLSTLAGVLGFQWNFWHWQQREKYG